MSKKNGPEPVGINPRVDCVFKTILGNPAHTDVLIDFLNAVLELESPIVSVEILNPTFPPDFVSGVFPRLDIVAVDGVGRRFQVEMQNHNEVALKPRMLFSWSRLYDRQLERGDEYAALRPVYSIWLLGKNIHSRADHFHHRFTVTDAVRGVVLCDHLQIHTLELSRWVAGKAVGAGSALRDWMRFFTEAKDWIDLPKDIERPVMETAMDILKKFRADKEWYANYRVQEDAERRRAAAERIARENEQNKEELARVEKELLDKRKKLDEKRQELDEKRQELDEKRQELDEKCQELDEKHQELLSTSEALESTSEALESTSEALESTSEALESTSEALESTSEALREKQRVLAERDAALAAERLEKERVLAEREALLAQLRSLGVEPTKPG